MSFFQSLFKTPTLFAIIGESNAEGFALNSDALGGEIGVQNSIQIFNNGTLNSFQTLNIGTNNMPNTVGTYHGFELELSNRIKNASKIKYTTPSHLLKTGVGSTKVDAWISGGVQYNTFINRVTGCKNSMLINNYKVCVLMSLGVNDGIAGTSANVFKVNLIQHLADIRAILGQETIIILTEFQGMGSGGTAYNYITTAIQEVCAVTTKTYSVNTSGAALLGDGNHWTYSGVKIVAGRMLDLYESL